MRVIVWNKENLACIRNSCDESHFATEYDYMRGMEEAEDCGISSKITVNNQDQLNQFIEAVEQETNVRLSYKILEE